MPKSSPSDFPELVKMLEQREKRQQKALEDTRAQLEQARAASKVKR